MQIRRAAYRLNAIPDRLRHSRIVITGDNEQVKHIPRHKDGIQIVVSCHFRDAAHGVDLLSPENKGGIASK